MLQASREIGRPSMFRLTPETTPALNVRHRAPSKSSGVIHDLTSPGEIRLVIDSLSARRSIATMSLRSLDLQQAYDVVGRQGVSACIMGACQHARIILTAPLAGTATSARPQFVHRARFGATGIYSARSHAALPAAGSNADSVWEYVCANYSAMWIRASGGAIRRFCGRHGRIGSWCFSGPC